MFYGVMGFLDMGVVSWALCWMRNNATKAESSTQKTSLDEEGKSWWDSLRLCGME